MYKNYFFLNRLVLEFNTRLKGFNLVEAYSQEKDRLIFRLTRDKEEKFIEISVSSFSPFMLMKDKMSRAKRNTIDFFEDFLPDKINNILIAENERIVKFEGTKCSFFFLIRGNDSNIIVQNESNEIVTFKNYEYEQKSQLADELKQINFIDSFYQPDLDIREDINYELMLREKYRTISKDLLREVRFRLKTDDVTEIHDTLINVLNEIRHDSPAVFYNQNTQELLLAVNSFRSFPYTEINEFSSLNDAIYYYKGRKYNLEKILSYKKIIEKHFKRELTKITSKLDNLMLRINTPSREEEYNKNANLLLININKLRKGLDRIIIEDIYNDSRELIIKLDESISPKENINSYFKKSKNEKINAEKSKLLYDITHKEFIKIKNLETKYFNSNKIEEIELIMKELKIEPNTSKGEKSYEEKINFKQYLVDKKYNVFVGKDSTNNDLLTTKFAKQNDYWFHARSVSGSHVVLRVDNTKEAVPKNILKAVASLAAYHSKAKTASVAPVSYTLKKYVYKKKGMAVGMVALTKEDVLLVKPEIPAICEYVTNE